MKKSLKLLVLVFSLVLCFGLVASTAMAASFTDCADALAELGLFKGTDNGYELDGTLTREQAATMLVRLLGKEDEALLSSAEKHPFTDVSEWADPYVSYLYREGITKGVTETTFEGKNPCTAQMYVTFMLRALGYTEAEEDFTYAAATDFAQEIGIADILTLGDESFLRDNTVAISYVALAQNLKGTEQTLLDKLVADKAVDAEKAKVYQTLFADFTAFNEASAKVNQETAMEMKATTTMTTEMGEVKQTANMEMNMKMIVNPEDLSDIQAAITAVTKVEGQDDVNISYYITDGVYYMDLGEEIGKVKMPFDMSELESLPLAEQSDTPLYMLSGLEKKEVEDGVEYTLQVSDSFFSSIMDQVMGAMGTTAEELQGVDVKISDVALKMTVDKDGNMKGMDIAMKVSTTVEDQTLVMTMSMQAEIIATGDAVKIEFPADLSEYKELAEVEAPTVEETPAA